MSNIIIHKVTRQEEITALGSALSWEGMNTDQDNLNSIFNWIEEYTSVKNKQIYLIKGRVMNDLYNLYGKNAYNDDLSIVCIDLNDIEEPQKLAIPRFNVGGRWLDDIVDNNLRRQAEHNNQCYKEWSMS